MFWRELEPRICPLFTHYESLAQSVAGAQLIVRGQPVDVISDMDGGYPVHKVLIAITEVLKGVPESRHDGPVEIWATWVSEDLASLMPSGEHVLFLTTEAALSTQPVPEAYRYTYYIDTWHQSVYRDIDGIVSVPDVAEIVEWQPASFSLNWHGRQYDELVERIRHLVRNATGSTVAPPTPIDLGSQAC